MSEDRSSEGAGSGSTRPPSPSDGRLARAKARADELKHTADELKHTAAEQVDVARRRVPGAEVVYQTWVLDRDRAGGLIAGGLAFKVFAWLLPFALVLVTLLGYGVDAAGSSVSDVTRSAGMSAAIAQTVAKSVSASTRGRILLLVVGLILALYTARGLTRALGLVQTLAWRVLEERRMRSVRAALTLVGFACLLIVEQWVGGALFWRGLVLDVVAVIVNTLFVFVICLVAAALMPRAEDASWTALIPGCALFAVGTRVMVVVTRVYFSHKLESQQGLYGALGMSIVILLWLYLLARLWITGVFLNATRWRHAHQAATLDPGGSPLG